MIARYQILDCACTTAGSHLYHVRCLKDGTPALLKVPSTKHTLPAQLSRFQREYDALQSEDISGFIKPATLINQDGRSAIVPANIAKEPLDPVLNRHRLDAPTCLRLGSELARILAGLHAAHIIHRDIRPANFMLCLQQGMQQQQLRLLDLSLAAFDTHSGSLNRRRK
jgi:serine/threonine protein kinase